MPIAAPFWDDDPDSWDTVLLAGSALPGLAHIEGLELGSKWDVKEAPGTDGATETYQGYTPSSFQLILRIWLPEQWTEWLKLAKTLRPKPGKETPKPVDIVHPDLAVWGISSAIIRKIKPKKTDGVYEISFDMLEWFPQPKKTVTTTAGAGGYRNVLDGLPLPGTTRMPAAPSTTRAKP